MVILEFTRHPGTGCIDRPLQPPVAVNTSRTSSAGRGEKTGDLRLTGEDLELLVLVRSISGLKYVTLDMGE